MSYGDIEERPRKKPRMFVDHPDDAPEPAIIPEVSLQDEIPAPVPADANTTGNATSFDPDSLEAIIGEKLSLGDVRKLESLSNGNLEQGETRYICACGSMSMCTNKHSYQSVL
jgi:hypothetical protein